MYSLLLMQGMCAPGSADVVITPRLCTKKALTCAFEHFFMLLLLLATGLCLAHMTELRMKFFLMPQSALTSS